LKECPKCRTQINSKATKCPQCQSDLRNWFRRHPVWSAIIFLVVFPLFVFMVSPADKNDNEKKTVSRSTTEVQQRGVENKPKEWIKVIEASGNSNKRTDLFGLQGGKARLSYVVGGDFAVLASFYVMEEGKSLEINGGFPEVMVTEPGSDSTFLVKRTGNYYLEVSSANSNWQVIIEEER